MKLLIRADANSFIATGHVMRCISIAQEAISEGHDVKFVVADLDAEVLLKKYDMPYICLHTTWNEMDGELENISKVIESEKPDCILVDSYYVTEKYLSGLRSLCRVAYIDDLNMFVYPCDILICYANFYKKFDYENRYSKETRLLLGPKYAPLRQSFSRLEFLDEKRDKKNILVMSGGTDEYHVISSFLDEYSKSKDDIESVNINAICGVFNNDYERLAEKYSGYPNINLLKSVDNIEKYMLETDVAVSAGGTTLYELCACGTPTICYSVADNQLDNVASFEADGVMVYAGDVRQNGTTVNIVSEAKKLLDDDDTRAKMRDTMRHLVDGAGAKRIIEEICP